MALWRRSIVLVGLDSKMPLGWFRGMHGLMELRLGVGVEWVILGLGEKWRGMGIIRELGGLRCRRIYKVHKILRAMSSLYSTPPPLLRILIIK